MAANHETWVRIPHAPPFNPGKPDLFRAEDEGLFVKLLPSQCLLVPFTVRTKEPADVFPRRARLGPSREIANFASEPVGIARRIQVHSGKAFGDMGPWWAGRV